MAFPPGRDQVRPSSFEYVPVQVAAGAPRAAEPTARQIVLFLLTIVTTTLVGGLHYVSFDLASQAGLELSTESFAALFRDPMFYVRGLWYSGTVLAILGCHEMGHYVYCRRYGVDASRPYFLPAPVVLTGTLGAFIRIRSRIPHKVALFDIGIAGPIAGFVVAVPALIIGLLMSNLVRFEPGEDAIWLGEPLLFRAAAWAIFGEVGDGLSINMHPVGFAAWFGLLATALNLFPIGQLDGGHISYAVLGPRSTLVTLLMVPIAIGLTFVSTSWMAWTVMLLAMLLIMGPHHPPTLDDSLPLDRGRLWLAGFALLMLVLCFTPAPIEPFVTGGR
jgi:membrane-associated protease RseP (regulator of RpoE activity)